MQNSDVNNVSSSLQITQALNNHLELSDHHILVDTTQSFQIQNNTNLPIQQIQNIIKNQEEDEDFLNYSLDQKSISFIMQQNIIIPHQNPQKTLKQNEILVNSNYNNNLHTPPLQDQSNKAQTKKKRREIFDKYKKQSTQNILFESNVNKSQFMDTFDQVFKLKSPDKQQKQTISTASGIKSAHSHPIIKQFRTKNLQQENMNLFKKKQSLIINTQKTNANVNVNANELKKLSENNINNIQGSSLSQIIGQIGQMQNKNHIKPTQNRQPLQKRQGLDNNINNVNFSMEERLSVILPSNPNQTSKDDADIQNILQSQLFNSARLDYTIHNHNQTSYKNIEISMNPSMMVDSQKEKSQNTLAFDQITSRMLVKQKSEAKLPTIIQGDLLSRNLSQQRLKITSNQFQRNIIKQAQPIELIIKERSQPYNQKRVPKFLRQIRKSNTLLPNFSFKKHLKQVHEQAKNHLKQLIILIQKALNLLNHINSSIRTKKIKISKAIALLINQHSLENFLNSKWEQYQNQKYQWLNQIRPNQNFVKRVYNYEKIQNALDNYLKIADYYLNAKLNLQQQKVIKKYYDIRLKFWEIQKNIKLISQDLYSEAIEKVIPIHYYEYLAFLKDTSRVKINQKNIQKRRLILAKYCYLKEEQDPLTLSCVGKAVKKKAQIQLYKMSIY